MNNQVAVKSAKIKFKEIFQKNFPVIGLITILLFFAIVTQFKSLELQNLELILNQSLVLLICASGVLFVMTMGSLDFSQGSIVGVASIAVVIFGQENLLFGVIAGILIGALIGALNGFIHSYLKIGSFIVTICFQLIFRGACQFLTTSRAYSAPIYMFTMNKNLFCIPIVLIVLIITYIVFEHTKIGRHVKAVGAGEVAAEFSGINVRRLRFIVFMVAGILAGLSASIYTLRVGSITATAGSFIETNIMIALVMGGMPITGGSKVKFINLIIGVFMLGILNNGLVMLGVEPNLQQIIRAIVFLLLVSLTTDHKSGNVIK